MESQDVEMSDGGGQQIGEGDAHGNIKFRMSDPARSNPAGPG
jgi:hypothetical protein